MRLLATIILGSALQVISSCSWGEQEKESIVSDIIQNGHQLDGEPLANRSVDAHGSYYAVAKNLFTTNIFCETGKNSKDANERALELCRDNALDRAGCVLSLPAINNYLLPRESGSNFAKWICFAEETAAGEGPEAFRTWVTCNGNAKDRTQAEKIAINQCRSQGAALSCRTVRCFNSDSDKRYR